MSILNSEPSLRLLVDKFRNTAIDFVATYPQQDGYRQVAIRITDILQCYGSLPLTDEQHPFNRFACGDLSHFHNMLNLKKVVKESFSQNLTSDIRDACVAFFHHGGSQRTALDELIAEYYDMVEYIMRFPFLLDSQ